ncbi:hyaluronan-binding protein 2 isoform X1 [Scophthalmus maximus]|uniref:hyaluronan-binding protein 2 isoform X1 n=1 Tax=Scophthalmus maximus TaxID=52904 RepID=UPI001FA857AC|nr:hyaluronan-binding protein 2 isoform X1 [Scophthalmus maximus]
MNLKLLFFCLFLAVLLIPAELKQKKDKKHHRHHDHDHEHGVSGHGRRGKHNKKRPSFGDIIKDSFFEIVERAYSNGDDDDDDDDEDWLSELQEPEGLCNPNPCLHNGVCEEKGKTKFKCDCPKPFKGRRCQKAKRICRKGLCGRGECVLTSNHPFYECKCKEPFQPPNCRSYEFCEPNPCKNGGECIINGNDFDCACPSGYRGRFCHVGPDDCYVDDGESYRGNVSETDDEDECLYWNSHFILDSGTNPFTSFEDNDGLGPHNFCRNPDGDAMPWCFFRRGRRLLWDYCDVRECSTPTDVSPTEIIPPVPDPTTAKPQPTKPEPTADIKPTTTQLPMTTKPPTTEKPTSTQLPVITIAPTTEKPSQAPQPSPVPTDGPTIPGSTVPPEQFSTCGQPQPKKPLTRIFGGLKVPPGALPWQVSLLVRPKNTNQQFRHICGGVLIASCWVLTAGHCIEQNKDMQVVMGGLSLDMTEYTEQTLRVEEAIVHENYTETPTAVYSDIALLRLNGTDGVCAEETQFVKTACLPDAQLPDGMECTISGWGATENSKYGSNRLLEANVLLINQHKCSERKIYGRILDNTMFCAGHLMGGVDSCQGDSGGPLTCKPNNASVIYGLVSWGDQCGRKNKPGVYTRVTHFLDWIKSKTQATFPSATSKTV